MEERWYGEELELCKSEYEEEQEDVGSTTLGGEA